MIVKYGRCFCLVVRICMDEAYGAVITRLSIQISQYGDCFFFVFTIQPLRKVLNVSD